MAVYLKETRKYLIAATLCFFVLPHLPQLCFPEFYQKICENSYGYTPIGLRLPADSGWGDFFYLFYNYCIYLIPPLFAGILGLVHVRREGTFCPVLSALAFLSVPTYLLWDANPWAAASVLASAIGMTLVDLTGLLSRFDGDAPEPEEPRRRYLLWGAAQNLSFLALLAFWMVALPICFQVYFTYAEAGHFTRTLYFTFMLYAPILALVLPLLYHDEDAPMTAGGMLTATILFLLSAVVCGCADSCKFRFENLLLLGGSYLIFVLTEGTMALWRRHKA